MKQRKCRNEGITLIALIITIIILLILSGITISTLTSNNGLFARAKQSKFLNEIGKYQEELSLYISNKQLQSNGEYIAESLNANSITVFESGKEDNTRTIKSIIPSINEDFQKKLEVISGKLVYIGTDKNEINWIKDTLSIESIKSNLTVIPNYTGIKVQIQTVGQLAEAQNIKDYDIYITETEEYKKIATVNGETLETEYNIDNLQQNTKYKIKVVTNSKDGTSVSSIIEAITNDDNKKPTITNIVVPEITNSKTIMISATIQDNDGGSGLNKNEVKYIIDNNAENYDITNEKWNNANKFNISEFSDNVIKKQVDFETSGEYYLHILASDIVGNNNSEVSTKIIIDIEAPKVVYDTKKIVVLNTTVDSNFLKQNNNITDNNSESDEIQIENLTVYSSNGVVSTKLTLYDNYKITFKAKDKAGNLSELITQTIITKPTSSITLTNIIPDSSFETGISGWTNGNPEVATDRVRTGSKALKCTIPLDQLFLRKNFGNLSIKDKDIYFRSYVNTNTKVAEPLLYAVSASDSNIWPSSDKGFQEYADINKCYNNWGIASVMLDKSYTLYNYLIIMLAQGSKEASGTIWWDDLMAIDLKPFGEIKTTRAWLDEMVTYFSGTKTFTW